jgi:microcystin-dependent protein
MSNRFLGEIRMVAFNFAPKGWASCDGQILSIQQNTALFSLLGTTFGGNGQTTFALPDLRGRAPLHPSQSIALGQVGGAETNTLAINQMPAHNHAVSASSAARNAGSPANNTWAVQSANAYGTQPNATMNPAALANSGGSAPHPNMQPYLTIHFCIALTGVFPSRN